METSSISSGQEGDSGIESNNSCESILFLRISVPELNLQKSLTFQPDDTVWVAKQQILSSIVKNIKDGFNYGLFIPPSEGKAGKFLDEERFLKDYALPGPIGFLEFKLKRRVYKVVPSSTKKTKDFSVKNTSKIIMDAIKKLDLEKVSKILNKGFDPNFIDADSGESPLTLASSLPGTCKLLMALFEGGSHLDFRCRKGLTALHTAAQCGNEENIKTLLNLGASPNYKNLSMLTPLYLCVCNDTSARCCEMLLYDQSVVGVVDDYGWTELHQTCKFGRVQHLELLIFYQACLDRQNCSGNTALHICAINNQEDCARVLMFRGASRSILNFANQDAAELAYVSGNSRLATIIREFQDALVVLHREVPTYNTRRRNHYRQKNFPLLPSRSFQCLPYSIEPNSGNESEGGLLEKPLDHFDQLPPRMLFLKKSIGQEGHPSLHLDDCSASTESTPEFQDDCIHNERKYAPRIVILFTNTSGYGFVLRGAKAPNKDSSIQLNFLPTKELPGLQYFESIEKGGMADKAGIKAGDFLLEINGIDVSRASHDYTVSLIRRVTTELKMKVVTTMSEQKKFEISLDVVVPHDEPNQDIKSAESLDSILIPAINYRRVNKLSTFSKLDSLGVASINSTHGKRLSACLKDIGDTYDGQAGLSRVFADSNSYSGNLVKSKSMFNVGQIVEEMNAFKRDDGEGRNIENNSGKKDAKFISSASSEDSPTMNVIKKEKINNLGVNLIKGFNSMQNIKHQLKETQDSKVDDNGDSEKRYSFSSYDKNGIGLRRPLPPLPPHANTEKNTNRNQKFIENANSSDVSDFLILAEKAREEFLSKSKLTSQKECFNKNDFPSQISSTMEYSFSSRKKIFEENKNCLNKEVDKKSNLKEQTIVTNIVDGKISSDKMYDKMLSELVEEEYITLNMITLPPPPPQFDDLQLISHLTIPPVPIAFKDNEKKEESILTVENHLPLTFSDIRNKLEKSYAHSVKQENTQFDINICQKTIQPKIIFPEV